MEGQLGFLEENVTATATTDAKAPALRCPIFYMGSEAALTAERAAAVQAFQAEEQQACLHLLQK